MDYVLLLAGFVLLIKGADYFVEGSASVAAKLHIPPLIIGLTVVAMGTSAPECAVSIAASLKGENAVAVSNVTGSNIFNLMMVCGVCALCSPLKVKAKTLKKEFPLSVLAAAVLLGAGYLGMEISRADGLILLLLFAAFLVWLVMEAKKARGSQKGQSEVRNLNGWLCLLYIAGGMGAIVIGGDLAVDAASAIAAGFGWSQTFIGLTIVAMGTSLPELVTSVAAAKKGETDMALGNVIGSNLFNILLVLGLAGAISPMEVLMEHLIDGIILIGMSCIVWIFAWCKKEISRLEGVVMITVYAVYMGYICIR
ncbi:MAG: calcium/sodium antiporter [Lachnospiraceae bacterium]|nr:calcium/sodium antiporter [Lachnospiraceae bacterium]